MLASTGFGDTARLDGSDAPAKSDESVDTVSVTMPDKSTLVETSKREGKPWLTMRMQVDASSKIAMVSWQNLKTNKTAGYEVLMQQPARPLRVGNFALLRRAEQCWLGKEKPAPLV